jgi:hypothetical protein
MGHVSAGIDSIAL